MQSAEVGLLALIEYELIAEDLLTKGKILTRVLCVLVFLVHFELLISL